MVLDRISNLPSEIIVEDILSRLTLKEAVRTSVLSSQWRHKWALLPDLEFDQLNSSENHTVASIIDQILLTHIGPIRKFKLWEHPAAYSDVDRWILHLSRNSCSSIKEFAYRNIMNLTKYEIPSSVYSFHCMIRLELRGCVLKPPTSTFKGFNSLKFLLLEDFDVDQDVLENMIRCCPLLERLTLVCNQIFGHFKINAPNLSYLFLYYGFGDVSIVNTSKLTEFFHISSFRGVFSSSPSLINFLGTLHHIQHLTIAPRCIAGGGILPKKLLNPLLLNPLPNLKFLTICIQCHDLREILTALCLLRSSPALERLIIMIDQFRRPANEAANSWLDGGHNCSFTELRHLEIFSVYGLEDELDLIQLLLSSSPVLETMIVSFSQMVDPDTSCDFKNKLEQCKRASPDLEMVFDGPES